MKKYFLGLLFALSSYFAIGQNNSAKSTINSNISNQGLRGITDAKLIATLNAIVDWAGSPASKRLTITQARALTTDYPAIIYITSGTAGLFTLDETDNTTADDGVNTIVTTANNKRYKRVSGSIASITGLQTALDTKANTANARFTGQMGVNVSSPSYDVDVAGGLRAAAGGVMGSGTMNPNAILDLQSTTKVFYPPRMTQAQRLAIASGSPGAGSVVYQSDGTPGLYAFDTSWKRLFTASDALPAAQITGLTKTSVGLGNVDNTADASKPVSFAQQAALDLKLSLAGGNLTGVLGMTNASGLQIYNSSTITADYDRGNIGWQNNVFTIDATRGGSGTLRPVGLKSIANTFNVNPGPSLTGRIFDINAISSVGSGQGIIASTGNISNSAGNTYNTALFSTVNQSGSAGHSELYISPYFQAVGGSPRYLIRAGTNTAAGGSGTHTDVFTVSQIGATYMAGSLTVDGIDGVYADKGVRAWGTAGKYAIRTANDVQSRYSSYDLKLNASADNDYNASYILQHYHKYDMFAPANTYTVFRAFQNKIMIGANTLPTEVLTVAGNTSVSGNIVNNGNLNIGENSDATSKTFNIGNSRTANGAVAIAMTDATGGLPGLTIQRQGSAGINSITELIHRGTGQFRLHAYEAADIDFATNSTSRMSISSAGVVNIANKITIGSTSSNADLQFSNAFQARKIVLAENANNDNQVYGFGFNSGLLRYQVANTGARHGFFAGTSTTASTEVLSVHGNSNVGIGTGPTPPISRLHISANNALSTITLSRSAFTAGSNIGGLGFSNAGNGYVSGITSLYTADSTASHLIFRAGTATGSLYGVSERMRITPEGRVGIGTSSPGQVLEVTGLNSAPATTSSNPDGIFMIRPTGSVLSLSAGGSTSGSPYMWFQARAANDYSVNYNLALQPNGGKISVGSTTPHSSTLVDFVSTTAGLGLPQLTTTQVNAIATPKAGLTVYNTTLNKLCYYNGTAWKQVTDSNM